MTTQRQVSLFIALAFLSVPTMVSAATISFRATPANVGAGDIVRIDVLLDSAIATNAFSGSLEFPSAILEPVAVSDGNSIVSMWVTRPLVTSAPIIFAGITPGGFSGTNGILFSVLFKVKVAGLARVSLTNREVLRNDGAGGNEPTVVQSLTLSIGAHSSGGYAEPADQTPPESFIALLGTDSQLFGDKAYLVFNTLDKGSGVDHYTVAESRLPSFLLRFFPLVWQESASPYVVANQNLTSAIYIKAIDRSGNERVSVYPPQHLFTIYEKVVFLAILIVVVLLWQSGWGRRRRLNL